MSTGTNGHRVAIVAGCRTPFCKSGTDLKAFTAVALARHATVELLHRGNLDGEQVDQMYFGQVVASPLAPNLAREVSLLPQFPRTIPAATVNRACSSANTAIAEAHDQIARGYARVVIAGGAESLSDIPILHSRRFADLLIGLSRARSLGERLRLLATFRPRDLVPVTPAIAEPSTGETMGQSAEKMAKVNGISREAQDRFALRSHHLAQAGTDDGRLWVTEDQGAHWSDLTAYLPAAAKGQRMERVEPSDADAATAYLVVGAYRSGNDAPLVYRTTDMCRSWQSVAGDLPKAWPARVVREVGNKLATGLKNPGRRRAGSRRHRGRSGSWCW